MLSAKDERQKVVTKAIKKLSTKRSRDDWSFFVLPPYYLLFSRFEVRVWEEKKNICRLCFLPSSTAFLWNLLWRFFLLLLHSKTFFLINSLKLIHSALNWVKFYAEILEEISFYSEWMSDQWVGRKFIL